MAFLWLGIAAGALQALGYLLYIRQSLKHEIEPNAATWLMFAYGTALLGVLEFSQDAEGSLLYLPMVCATGSIVVASICWQRGKLHWPKQWQDQFAFACDLVITACYVGAWALATFDGLGEEDRRYANLAFLVCSNLTTLTSFSPLVRGAEKHESPLPWVVWVFAYSMLGLATYQKHGMWSELMIYPILNMALHMRVAWLAQNRAH